MYNSIAKKTFLLLLMFMVVTLACDISFTVAPATGQAPIPTSTSAPVSITSIPATLVPTQIQSSFTAIPATDAPNATLAGVEVSVGPLSIVLPAALCSGARGSQIPRAEGESVAPWEVTPGHTLLTLESYLLQGKTHQPQIYVYPTQAYAQMFPGAFESMHRLDNILLGDQNAPISSEQLPAVPFFSAQQVFASHIARISFQNGRGVRFLTEYAQYPISANNQDLFYHFQGLTNDGAYYIVAILPITAPELAETSDAGAALPAGGVPYPYLSDPQADMQSYYHSVIDVLNATPPEDFNPTISQLDSLIQSMHITP